MCDVARLHLAVVTCIVWVATKRSETMDVPMWPSVLVGVFLFCVSILVVRDGLMKLGFTKTQVHWGMGAMVALWAIGSMFFVWIV